MDYQKLEGTQRIERLPAAFVEVNTKSEFCIAPRIGVIFYDQIIYRLYYLK